MVLWDLNGELQVKFNPLQMEFRVNFFVDKKMDYTIVLSFLLSSQITYEIIVLFQSNLKCQR